MDVEEAIRRTVSELKKTPETKAVILFGSTARGKRKPYSDIDIAVVLDPPTREAEAEAGSLSSNIVEISLFHRLDPFIQFRIMKEGKVLFSRGRRTVPSLKMRVAHRYMDHLPLYRAVGLA